MLSCTSRRQACKWWTLTDMFHLVGFPGSCQLTRSRIQKKVWFAQHPEDTKFSYFAQLQLQCQHRLSSQDKDLLGALVWDRHAGKGLCGYAAFFSFKFFFALAEACSGDRKTWGNGNKMCTLLILKKIQYNSIINKPLQTSINSSWNLSKEHGGFAKVHSARVKIFCLLFSHLSLPCSIKLSSKGSKGKQGTRGERRQGNPGLWLSTFWCFASTEAEWSHVAKLLVHSCIGLRRNPIQLN